MSNGVEKRLLTVVYCESHISELCEKWIDSWDNYAYSKFEEFRTCSGEILFTNKHKAVLSKKDAIRYIDYNNLEIFKWFSTDTKTVFMNKPITANTLEIIKAKKNKDSSLLSIENYAFIIDNVCSLIFDTICNGNSNRMEISRLFAKHSNLTVQKRIRKRVP